MPSPAGRTRLSFIIPCGEGGIGKWSWTRGHFRDLAAGAAAALARLGRHGIPGAASVLLEQPPRPGLSPGCRHGGDRSGDRPTGRLTTWSENRLQGPRIGGAHRLHEGRIRSAWPPCFHSCRTRAFLDAAISPGGWGSRIGGAFLGGRADQHLTSRTNGASQGCPPFPSEATGRTASPLRTISGLRAEDPLDLVLSTLSTMPIPPPCPTGTPEARHGDSPGFAVRDGLLADSRVRPRRAGGDSW